MVESPTHGDINEEELPLTSHLEDFVNEGGQTISREVKCGENYYCLMDGKLCCSRCL